jgi:hypothetical protein
LLTQAETRDERPFIAHVSVRVDMIKTHKLAIMREKWVNVQMEATIMKSDYKMKCDRDPADLYASLEDVAITSASQDL